MQCSRYQIKVVQHGGASRVADVRYFDSLVKQIFDGHLLFKLALGVMADVRLEVVETHSTTTTVQLCTTPSPSSLPALTG